MGDRLDNLGDTVKKSGGVIADASFGALDAVILMAYPVFLMGLVAAVTVALVKLPQVMFGGGEESGE